GTAVAHADLDLPAVSGGVDLDSPARRGVPQRIVEQVAQNALQTIGVGVDSGWLNTGRKGFFQTDVVLGGWRLVGGHGFGDKPGEVNRDAAQAQRAAVDLAQLEKVVNQAAQM